MKINELLEWGRIVKGVNTTVDVDTDEIKTQAAKFGNTVDRDGRPPSLSKKVKGSKTNVLYNLGLAETYTTMEIACIEGGHSLEDLKPLKEKTKTPGKIFETLTNLTENFENDKRSKCKAIIETVDIDAIHAEMLEQHLLSNPELYENNKDYQDLKKFLDFYKTPSPTVGNSYLYASIQSVPAFKLVNIAHFSQSHELKKIDDQYAYFEINDSINRYPESGKIQGDVFTQVYFFNDIKELEKFIMMLELKFSDYTKNTKILGKSITTEDIAPHGSPEQEAQLMIAGKKPAALTYEQDFLKHFQAPAEMYDWVVLKFDPPNSAYTKYVVAQPGESDRAKQIASLVTTANKINFKFQNKNQEIKYHRTLGNLLGYKESDIDDFIKNIKEDS